MGNKNKSNKVQIIDVIVKWPDRVKDPEKPKSGISSGLIIVLVIGTICLCAKGMLATLITFLCSILVIVGLVVYGKIKNK